VARDILYEVQRSYSPGRIGFGGQKLHQDVIILQIQHWLEEHFADKFRFEDVAREHGMSIRNFMRRFQTATGDKPLHYLQRLRIETAKGLLSGSARASRPSATRSATTMRASSRACSASTPSCRRTSIGSSFSSRPA
jgi:transcriptional regulator GlxA family with amidase domain